MRWDATPRAGFTAGTPWLPMGDDLEHINVATERAEPASSLQLHRALLALRRTEPALSVGAWAPLAADGALLAYERSHAGRRFVITLNLGHVALKADVLGGRVGRVRLSTVLDRADERVAGRLELRPDEGLIVEVGVDGDADSPG